MEVDINLSHLQMEEEELADVATAMFNLSLSNSSLPLVPTKSYPTSMWDPEWRWEVEMQDPPFHQKYAVVSQEVTV